MNPITKILSKKFPVGIAKVTSKKDFYCLHIPLIPSMYRDDQKNFVLTGNQIVTVANANGGVYGTVETVAKIRKYRTKEFYLGTVNETIVMGKTMLDVATNLAK